MMKRFTCLLALVLLAAPSFGATYILQPDGTVTEQKAADCPKSCDCGCQNGETCLCTAKSKESLPFVEATADVQFTTICDGLNCRQVATLVPTQAAPALQPAPATVSYSTSYETHSEAVFPRIANFRAKRGHAPTFTRTYTVTAPNAVAVECAPVSFAPVPQATAAAMPQGQAPVKLVRIGGHFINADAADKLKAAGFSWLDIVQLVLKYGPSIIDDILKLIGK